MTMYDREHPTNELLAALAGRDAVAVADAALAAHVAHCEQCRTLIADLHELRAALAELPDVAPPRPLLLVPPVPEPAPRRGWLVRLRAIAGPAMVAGGAMVLVGAIGLGGEAAGSLSGGAALEPAVQEAAGDRGTGGEASAAPDSFATMVPSQPSSRDLSGEPPSDGASAMPDTLPWILVVLAGGGLLGGGLVLRFGISPRAG